MTVIKRYTFREKFSWALYDWANSVFATTVLAGFFPLFFKSFWAGDLDDATSTALLGTASSVAGFIIVLIAPIFFWLVLNVLIHFYLKGAGFFIIPVFIALLILAMSIFMNIETKAKPILFTIISIPTIYIFAPMIKMFPVGLGLKSLFISAIFIVLIFVLVTPIFFQPKSRKRITKIIGFASIVFFSVGINTFLSKTRPASE